MELKGLHYDLSVCQVKEIRSADLTGELFFIGQTDEELSLVCQTERVPEDALKREDGWKAFRIQGVLDFSLVGILAPIATILANHKIGIFAVSTYNTDYILVKEEEFARAGDVLAANGYVIV